MLEGLDLSPRSDSSDILAQILLQKADSVIPAEQTPTPLGTPVLLAVLFLTVVGAGLVRTGLISRRIKRLR